MVTYLERTAERAASCAAQFGAAELDYWAGLSHDLGKFHLEFQTYLISLKSRRESDHSTAEQALRTGGTKPAGATPMKVYLAQRTRKGVGSLYMDVLSIVRDGRSHLSRRRNAGVDPASRNTAAQRLLHTIASPFAYASE